MNEIVVVQRREESFEYVVYVAVYLRHLLLLSSSAASAAAAAAVAVAVAVFLYLNFHHGSL